MSISTKIKEKMAKSQAEALAAEFDANAAIIQRMFGVDEFEYHGYKLNSGYDLLASEIDPNEEAFKKVIASEEYWAWFHNQWGLRERAFMHMFKPVEILATRKPIAIYKLGETWHTIHALGLMQNHTAYGLTNVIAEVLCPKNT